MIIGNGNLLNCLEKIIFSESWQALTKSEINILLYAFCKDGVFSKYKEIVIPYQELQDALSYGTRKGSALSTITRALRRLVEVGFIEVVHQGGIGPGDKTIYKFSDKWERYMAISGNVGVKEPRVDRRGFCAPGSMRMFQQRSGD